MLGDTIAAEIGDITRFPTPGKLVGYTEAVPDGAPVRPLGPPRAPDQERPQVPAWALIEAATHAARHPAYRNRYQTTKTRLGRRPVEAWDDDLRDGYTRMCADRAHELAHGASPRLDDWDAVIEPSIPEGPALLGFVAARIGEEIAGPAAYEAERARQAEWLTERLQLHG